MGATIQGNTVFLNLLVESVILVYTRDCKLCFLTSETFEQVEVENGSNFLTDHSSSILIFKRTVDELNKQVKLLGREKLDRMRQNMDFKRGIHLLEWEHRKLRMQAEDLQKKAKEIQTLKLTKEIQNRMQESNTVRGNSKADMDLLERTLEYNKKAHDSRVSCTAILQVLPCYDVLIHSLILTEYHLRAICTPWKL